MRLIDADAFHDYLRTKKTWNLKREGKHNVGYTYDQVHFGIDAQPSVDAAPVRHGRWLRAGEPPLYIIECSECRQLFFHHAGQAMPKYCLECGARMDGGDENETD